MEATLHRHIRRLPSETASRIAAGEVIDRPLSALKEVVENALDARARAIEVRVERSLDHAFTVADDGVGIGPDDLALAFERHATSKIAVFEDLDRIATLGFRGEALPSIAAVARVRLASRPADVEAAATLAIEGGAIVEEGHAARAAGTTVEVRDLFFNTPARRKFLHSPAGELRAAFRMLESYALGWPEVGFRLVVDGRERFEWPAAATRRERAAAVWGARHVEQLLDVAGERDGIEVEGLLGLPEHARATRDGQVFLVNRRWIQSPLLSQALRQAYHNLLPAGRFPAAVLWISIPPARLDVNVHPTKREVRFAEDDGVFRLVAAAAARPLATIQPPFTVVSGGTSAAPTWSDRVRETPREQTAFDLAVSSPATPPADPNAAASTTPAPAREGEPEFWQLHRTYILAPVRGGLVLIDQHAAHERILYEEALARLEGERGASQRVLFPTLVDLTPTQFDLLLELGPWIEQLGWDLNLLGPPTVVIQGVPEGLKRDRPGQVLQDLLDGVGEASGRDARQDLAHRVAASWACHAAVRAGDPLTPLEMKTLVDRLFGTQRPHGDPHGRVTYVRLGLDELHRRFGRG